MRNVYCVCACFRMVLVSAKLWGHEFRGPDDVHREAQSKKSRVRPWANLDAFRVSPWPSYAAVEDCGARFWFQESPREAEDVSGRSLGRRNNMIP